MTEVRPPAYPPADSELTVAILYKDEQASNKEQLKKGPNETTNSLNSGRELGTLFNQMAIGECRDEIVSTFQSSKGAVSSINRNTTNTENDHDIHYMDGYINENEDAEIQRELGQAVLKAATDTALATQNIEGADGRRKVAHLCQDQKNFSRNELTLRKVSA